LLLYAIIIALKKKATLFAYPSVLKMLMRAYAVSDLLGCRFEAILIAEKQEF